MRSFICLAFSAFVALALAGCEKRIDGDGGGDGRDFILTTSIGAPTRVATRADSGTRTLTDGTGVGASASAAAATGAAAGAATAADAYIDSRVDKDSKAFISGDKIGLYMAQTSTPIESVGNQIDNLLFSYNGTLWNGELTTASLVGNTFNAYSYYPYSEGTANAKEIEYRVKVDQSAGIVPKTDYLLCGKSASVITVDRTSNTPTAIPLSFTNCLTKVIAIVTAPSTYNNKEVVGIDSVWLLHQPQSCKLDIATGSLSYDIYADRVAVSMFQRAANSTTRLYEYECLTIPNSVSASSEYLKIKLKYRDGGAEYMYSYAPSAGVTFSGNQIHALEISSNELSCYTDFVFGAAGGTISADVRTNMSESYTLKSNDSWITVADNKNVSVTGLNSSLQPRLGSLILSNGVITRQIVVLQEATVTIAGVKWLTTNLTGTAGTASGHTLCAAPSDYGMFFKWGSTFVYGRASNVNEGGGFGEETKGASTIPTIPSKGYDYALGLNGTWAGDPCQKLGSSYKTPTSAQIKSLHDSGKSVFCSYNGVAGWFFGAGATGLTGNVTAMPAGCIFFPAAGLRSDNSGAFDYQDSYGFYWSSSVYDANQGWYLHFYSNGYINPEDANYRSSGLSVRCVEDVSIPTVEIAGTKWTVANLTGTAGSASGYALCANPFDYGMFFKWAATFVYGRASSATEGAGFVNLNYTLGSSTQPTTQSKGYDYGSSLLNGPHVGDPCQKLGSSYRTPTSAQLKALHDSGNSGWKSYQGVNGWFFGPKATSCNNTTLQDGCLFFPAAGYRYAWTGSLDHQGSQGYYWSSSVNDADRGRDLYFYSNGTIYPEGNDVRSNGLSVRCVEQ